MLVREETANAKAGYSPLLVRKCTNQGGNNNKWACVTNLLDFPLVPSFCFGGLVQSKLWSKCSGFYFPRHLPLLGKSPKNVKRAYLFPNSETPAARVGQVLPGEDASPPPAPRGFAVSLSASSQSPVQRQGTHILMRVHAYSPNFTPVEQPYAVWTKSPSRLPVQDAFWSIMVTKAAFSPI